MSNEEKKVIRVALAGQPNVGKSVIFNNLTGLNQVIGNWPGKTIKKAEGFMNFNGYKFHIIDLPGIYNLSTYSLEEIVSREYILNQNPDYIINVIDANQLERNLYLTLQLFLLKKPVIIALNQYDILQERGFEIDTDKMEKILNAEVVKTIAVHNRGLHELLEKIIELEEQANKPKPLQISFGKEIESEINNVMVDVKKEDLHVKEPMRFFAQKVLEGDEYCLDVVEKKYKEKERDSANFKEKIQVYAKCLEDTHGHSISEVFNAEYYVKTSQIVNEVLRIEKETKKKKIRNFFDHITVHSLWGYVILALIMMGTYLFVFWSGALIADSLDLVYEGWSSGVLESWEETSWQYRIIWKAGVGGLIAGIGGVLPFVIPFYIIIEILQDVGYLPRAAYLMDRFMHTVGLHGKAIIPILLGFGCNVPAITAAMIMDSEKQKKRSMIISSFVPCSAVTTIALGLVARYLGLWYAVGLYGINFIVIMIIGRIMKKIDPDPDSELIIEFHDFRTPNTKVILKQTWHRSKEFVYRALPLIVIFGIMIEILMEYNLLEPINMVFKPITYYYLGLPVGISIFLFYGVLRKELNLVLLQVYVASLGLTMLEYMTPIQMITFTLVTMLYVPCLATILTIKHHEGTKFATQVFFLMLAVALIIAGIVRWLYELVIIIL